MMAVFQSVYPEKGLLLVVDEVLDYLRQPGLVSQQAHRR